MPQDPTGGDARAEAESEDGEARAGARAAEGTEGRETRLSAQHRAGGIWGGELEPGRQKAAGLGFIGPQLSLRRATADLKGFSFAVRNPGTAARPVTFYGSCVTVVNPAGARAERLHVKVTTFHGPIAPGKHALTHACPSGWVALAAVSRPSRR